MKNFSFFIKDCWTITQRNLKLSFRSPDTMIMAIMMPVAMMILFVFLFGGAMDTAQFGGIKYVNYIVAAVMILCIGQSSMNTAITVSSDMQTGMIERFNSLPISKSAFLIGHVSASVIRNVVSTIIVLAVAFAIGFRPSANFIEWLGVAGIMIAFMIVMAWLSVLFGLIAKTPDGASGYMMIFFLLPYLSSGFVPTHTMPVVMRQIAEYQPMTPIIDTLRSLFLGVGDPQWLATILWSAGLLVVGHMLSLLVFKRRTR